MQLTRTRTPDERDHRQSFFLTAYRDHLLSELAEVDRRLAEFQGSQSSQRTPVGLES